jgi:hypothetical protein
MGQWDSFIVLPSEGVFNPHYKVTIYDFNYLQGH